MKDTYFDLLCDKIEKEYNEYIAELKKGSIEDLLYRCYEKVIKDEIVDIFCEEELTEDEAHKLYNQPNSLDYIFNEWVSNGVGIRARLIDCIHDCTDDIVLFITDDHAKAKSEGKETEWFDSLRYNAHCAVLLENEISRHYDYETSHMDAEGVINDMLYVCDKERLSYLLASQVYKRDYDGRFDNSTKEWANKVMEGVPDWLKDKSRNYIKNAHSGLVNIVVKEFMKREQSREAIRKDLSDRFL